MLREIHLSKISYCSFRDKPNDNQQDIIVENLSEITPKVVEEAREAKATRLSKDGIPTKPKDISVDDLVFRVMTEEHIPLVPKKKSKAAQTKAEKKAKSEAVFDDLLDDDIDEYVDQNDPDVEMVPMRTNFPPFFHYRIINEAKDDELFRSNDHYNFEIVGKSHWKGSLEGGEFCQTHGKTTDNLAMMYMKLCERYGTRSNWRGYCVDEETECLTQRGWLKESDLTVHDKIMSYNGSEMIWSPVRSIFRDKYNGKMFKMTSRSIDALMTPGHKIVTDKGLVKIEHLLESDKIVVMGSGVKNDNTKVYSDSFIELLGWITTEGNYQPKKKIITIYQNEGEYAKRIRKCLTSLGYGYTEKPSKKSSNITFSIKREHWDEIVDVMPNKNLTMPLILLLTKDQRDLLINTMIDGGGHRNGLLMRYTQKDKEHIDMFQSLCALHGIKTNIHFVENKMSFGKPTSYYVMNIFSKRGNNTRGACVDLHGGKNDGKKFVGKGKQFHPNFPTVNYEGTVWCPETDYGCFLARRNGKVYLTGNTYNDEMQGQALVQLTHIGLRFNELKSQNPFAYYTAVVTNSFTRVLNIEKRMQEIRDDILEANGMTPSWTRQLSNEESTKK